MDQPLPFVNGEEVEVTSQEPGFEGCWFIASIIRKPANKRNTFMVEYQRLLDDQGLKPLKEFVELKNIRPLQPQGPPRLFKKKEEVDAFHNDGWWKGMIVEVLQNPYYIVEFQYSDEKMVFKESDLRPHLEWIDGKWVNLAQQNQEVAVVIDACSHLNSDLMEVECSVALSLPRCNTQCLEELHVVLPTKQTKETSTPLQEDDRLNKQSGITVKRKRGRPQGSATEPEAGMDVANGEINQAQVLCLSSLEMPLIVENNEDSQVALDEAMDERDTPLDSVVDLQQPLIVPQNSPPPVIHEEQQIHLFEKTLAMWKLYEGSEVFKRNPQDPHFLPLENELEELRERKALGYMLMYEDLVSKTDKASFEEERRVFANRLGELNELEEHGFKVSSLRWKLEKMLEIKDKLDEDCNRPDSSKLEIEEAENELDYLKRQLETLSARKEKVSRNLERLRKLREEAEERAQQLRLEFSHVASAP